MFLVGKHYSGCVSEAANYVIFMELLAVQHLSNAMRKPR